MKILRVCLVSLVTLLLCAEAHRLLAGATHEPETKFALDRPLDIEHIKLDLKVDVKGKTVAGQVAIDATALRDVDKIQLDAVDFDVERVQIAYPASEQWASCNFENDGKHLTVRLPRTLATGGRVRVLVDYKVTDPQAGLSFYAPGDDDPEAPYLMWSQGESITNRYWVPCFDHPNERQTTEIVCTVDKPFTVISNGRLTDQKDNPDGTRTFHWLQDKPHVSYLMTLIVGEFYSKTVQWRGKPVSFRVREKFKDKIDNSFAHTTGMLDFFSDKIGVEYPWDKYDQVCCYNFGGGMENTSAATLTETTLHDDRAHLDDDSDGLVAHELAHQWWGDLLTCRDWAHIWLNEGFASYFEALWDEHQLGAEEFALNMYGKSRGALEGGKDKPIVYRNYKDPDEQFDSRAYPKGAWVLHMIRRRLGDELFWKALNAYTTRYAYKTVETVDLRKTIEDVTGRSFERFFYDWTERPGHPVVEIEYKWQEDEGQARIEVKQIQKDDAFAFPLTLEFVVEEAAAPHRVTKEITRKEQTFFVPMDKPPRMVRVDPDNAVLMDLTLDLPRNCWEAMLADDPNPVGRLRAVEHFGKSESKRDIQLLCKRLTQEKFWGVQRRIAEALGDSNSDTARDALLAAASIENAKARAAVVRALGRFEDDEKAAEALLAIVKKGDSSYRVEAGAIAAYADVVGEKSCDLLKASIDRDSDNELIRREVLRAIGEHGGDDALSLLIEWTAPGKPSQCRGAAVEAVGALLEREDIDKVRQKKGVEAIVKCLRGKGSRRLQVAALESLDKLGKKGKPALKDIDRLSRIGGPRVRATALKVAKKIREGPAGAPEASDDLRKRLSRLEKENRDLKRRLDRLDTEEAATNTQDE